MQLPLVLGSGEEDPRSSCLSSPRVTKCVARPGMASTRLWICSTTWDEAEVRHSGKEAVHCCNDVMFGNWKYYCDTTGHLEVC